jgi:hypothetical protein
MIFVAFSSRKNLSTQVIKCHLVEAQKPSQSMMMRFLEFLEQITQESSRLGVFDGYWSTMDTP